MEELNLLREPEWYKARGSLSTVFGIIYASLQHGKRTQNVPFVKTCQVGGRVLEPSLMSDFTNSS